MVDTLALYNDDVFNGLKQQVLELNYKQLYQTMSWFAFCFFVFLSHYFHWIWSADYEGLGEKGITLSQKTSISHQSFEPEASISNHKYAALHYYMIGINSESWHLELKSLAPLVVCHRNTFWPLLCIPRTAIRYNGITLAYWVHSGLYLLTYHQVKSSNQANVPCELSYAGTVRLRCTGDKVYHVGLWSHLIIMCTCGCTT